MCVDRLSWCILWGARRFIMLGWLAGIGCYSFIFSSSGWTPCSCRICCPRRASVFRCFLGWCLILEFGPGRIGLGEYLIVWRFIWLQSRRAWKMRMGMFCRPCLCTCRCLGWSACWISVSFTLELCTLRLSYPCRKSRSSWTCQSCLFSAQTSLSTSWRKHSAVCGFRRLAART